MTKQESIERALALFDEGYACSQSILMTYAGLFDLDEDTAKKISSTFGGGMGHLRQKCGALTGSFMVLGLAYGNRDPKDMETKLTAYRKVRELNQLIEEIHGSSNCFELISKHATEAQITERKHHKSICRQVVADTAGALFDMLQKESQF